MTLRWEPVLHYLTPLLLATMVTLLVLQVAVQNDRYAALEKRVSANTERLLAGQADRYTGTMAAAEREVRAKRMQATDDRIDALEKRIAALEARKPR